MTATASAQQIANRQQLYSLAVGLDAICELTLKQIEHFCKLAGIEMGGRCLCSQVQDAFFEYYRASLTSIDRRAPFLMPCKAKGYKQALAQHQDAEPWLVVLHAKGNLYRA